MGLDELKCYIRVDYDDDDDLIRLMLDAVLDEMDELIRGFDREHPTNRQKLLICAYVKELYDARDLVEGKTGSKQKETLGAERMRFVVQSMMLKEKLRGMT